MDAERRGPGVGRRGDVESHTTPRRQETLFWTPGLRGVSHSNKHPKGSTSGCREGGRSGRWGFISFHVGFHPKQPTRGHSGVK